MASPVAKAWSWLSGDSRRECSVAINKLVFMDAREGAGHNRCPADARERTMIVVPQRESMGCAVACVASRLGLSYGQSRLLFSVAPPQGLGGGFNRAAVMRALARGGAKAALTVLRSRDWKARVAAIPVGAIVCVRRWPRDRLLHYVVRSAAAEWLDPLDADSSKKALAWKGPCIRGTVRRRWPRNWVPLSFIDVRLSEDR